MGLGAVLALLLTFAAKHLGWVATTVPSFPLIGLIMVLCFGFYLIRQFLRLAYGTVELSIGVLVIFSAMGRAPEVIDDPATGTLLLVQLAAGIYIIIRGFDNFAQAQPFAGGGAAFREVWNLIRARWGRKRKE
jgi:hypothetical protein